MKDELLIILKHDLHKIGLGKSHRQVYEELSIDGKKADSIASWFSRNFLRNDFSNSPFRKSLVFNFQKNNNFREYRLRIKNIVKNLFDENDPINLHKKIIGSKILSLYSEARSFPYSCLKYHILLTCAFFFNFKKTNNNNFKKLYLGENVDANEFQVIFRAPGFEWSLTTNEGISRIYPKFNETWIRRMKKSIGGDRFLDGLLAQISSWSCALATIEDYIEIEK
ncbi:MAG: hypothetical protein ACTSPY_08560 [Candidatus Helarchaeota archaeon]